mmetsp:Transcript_73340/g.141870  ORF Transcript_73340/g.141870 Transcript_73340/m.141870 type:complete len:85 (-) Transcript_73340:244-498(-)
MIAYSALPYKRGKGAEHVDHASTTMLDSLSKSTIESVNNFHEQGNRLLAMISSQGQDCSCEIDEDANEANCTRMPALQYLQAIT